eukprot:g13344.t1
MTFKRPRFTPSRSYEVNVEDDVIPLLRIWIVSARGLPRSAGAVGMPDPYVIVKFNGDKVGSTKADRKTRRPEWNQNFLIRSDLTEPAPPTVDRHWHDLRRGPGGDGGGDSSNPDEGCGSHRDDGALDGRNHCSCSAASDSQADSADEAGTSPHRRSEDSVRQASGRCDACRQAGRGLDEVVLEVWDQYIRDDEKVEVGAGAGAKDGSDKKKRRSSTSKPNDLFDDRLFDVSFVSRCFQKGALRRVQGAVIGGDRLIGVCHISSTELRALGSSTVPADLKLRDPRGSWWSSSRGTIRVAVSLERLQANIIRAALPPNRAPVGVPLGAGVGAGGVARAAVQEAKGEEALPPAELSCKVLWNGQDFSSPSRWDKVFCMTMTNNQLWLDVRAPPDLASSRGLSPTPRPPNRASFLAAQTGVDALHPTTATATKSDVSPVAATVTAAASAAAPADAISPAAAALETLESPAISPRTPQEHEQEQERLLAASRRRRRSQPSVAPGTADGKGRSAEGNGGEEEKGAEEGDAREVVGVEGLRVEGEAVGDEASTAPISPATAPSTVAASQVVPSPVAAIAAAVATAAAAPAAVLLEGVLAVARSARPAGRRSQRGKRRSAVVETNWAGDRSCVLTVGLGYHLSTFDAQGLADMLNSSEESTERMAGTKEWHDKGFRLHWDPVRRRFTILNVSRRSFVLRGGVSSLATGLLGFGNKDHVSEPVAEALLDPQHPSDPPRRHMAVTGDSLPLPLVRPHWVRILWGPPAMEITRGGELRVQVWARQPAGSILRSMHRRRRRRSALSGTGQGDDGSWLVGTAILDSAEVCRLATGKPTKLPLLSPPALWRYERIKSATAARIAATNKALALEVGASSSAAPVANGAGFLLTVLTAPRTFLARQRQGIRRIKRRIAYAGSEGDRNGTPLGAGGARVRWSLPPPPQRKRSGSRTTTGRSVSTPVRRIQRLPSGPGDTCLGKLTPDKVAPSRRVAAAAAGAGGQEGGGEERHKGRAGVSSGIVGHVWVSLKLRDPSMLLMRVVRQWNMARDEASVQQRRAARLEAKRLWMFMPGISLWRVLVQLAGMSLLVSYCVTLTLRAYHSTSCKATFNCTEETDPKLASLREWQTLADNMLSVLSFLDMLLQFRTGYVDKNSKIVINPKKVGLHYLRTWFIPDLWCSLPYGTMQPLLQPLLDEVEGAADSLSSARADHVAGLAMSESYVKAADSPLSLWVLKLSKRLHIGKINSIRGTRAFKYLDDSAMGVDLAVKQVVHVIHGRRRVLNWLGNPPKQRGRIGKFFFRVGVTNKWTRIVLSYRLLGYAKVIGTLVRAMRVLALAVRAVPRATRVLRLAAVFIRSYEGRRRSKDLHEASIVIQRRAGQHMALKVAGQLKTNLRRRTRASSESDILTSSSCAVAAAAAAATAAAASSAEPDRARVVSDAPPSSSLGSACAGRFYAAGELAQGDVSPLSRLCRSPRQWRGMSTPPRSPALGSDGGSGSVLGGFGGRMPYPSLTRTPSNSSDNRHGIENRQRSPSAIRSESWSDCSLDDAHDPRSPPRMTANWTAGGDDMAVTPITPPYSGTAARRTRRSSVNASANENGVRAMAIPPWTRSTSDLRERSCSPRPASGAHGPRKQYEQQHGVHLTLDAVHQDGGVGGDGDYVSFVSGSGGSGGLSGSGGVSASSVRYDAW